jgi:spectinomycin phosphotransferase
LYGRPPVTIRALVAAIRDAYGIVPSRVRFLPLGHDARAWVYRVEELGGGTWLAKLRDGIPELAAVRVPRHLHEGGLKEVVAAITTRSGEPWAAIGAATLVLTPFVEGASAVARPLDDEQWRAYGRFLGALHAVRLPPALARSVPRETFRPYNATGVRALVAERPLPPRGPQRAGLAAVWRDQAVRITRLLDRAEVLGHDLARRRPPHVVCHADIHRANILVDDAGRLRVIDWDGVVLAPRERDLMFVIDGIIAGPPVTPREEALFREGYGPLDADAVALAYYRHAWAIQDIGEFAEQVLRRGPVARAERDHALELLAGQFDPDGQVPAAEAGWEAVAATLP